MKKFLVVLFTVIFSQLFLFSINAQAATADISNLVFTTPGRTVSPGTVSDSIVVQTQNASGGVAEVDETNDVTFSSTSGTGQFLNSSGNPVSTTMSKNTSSRTFFYKDSTAGTYTLTVAIKGRTTGVTFSASQSIIIGLPVSGSTSTTTATSTSSTATTTESTQNNSNSNTQTESSSQTVFISAHSSSDDISKYSALPEFKTDAGRERVVTVNSPVEFDAKVGEFSSNLYAQVFAEWSFGDGTKGVGKTVEHSYVFPGDYIVVLNTTIGASHAVSRTKVKVIAPEVSIVDVRKGDGGYVEIKNNSTYEINLQNWKLFSNGQSFFFANDTILAPSARIKFPFSFNLDAQNITLAYPNGDILNTPFVGDLSSGINVYRGDSFAGNDIKNDDGTRFDTVIADDSEELNDGVDASVQGIVREASTSEKKSDQSALLFDALKNSKNSTSVFSSLFDIPYKAFGFLYSIFKK